MGYSNTPGSYIMRLLWSRRRKIYYLSGHRARAEKIASKSRRRWTTEGDLTYLIAKLLYFSSGTETWNNGMGIHGLGEAGLASEIDGSFVVRAHIAAMTKPTNQATNQRVQPTSFLYVCFKNERDITHRREGESKRVEFEKEFIAVVLPYSSSRFSKLKLFQEE
ncbi:uncharacterized protein LOC118446868 [Vespa mandarinia]|uniref:uncharacterized protein LOC118446868 n=1 Tax=Vespa mandarinia TaxID=7446 RepID=UPI001609860E|nr:uncharacterized protein LOC118446868 [Vespa mandarinia]